MDIKGKITMFVKEVGEKEKYKVFSTTISRKKGDRYVDNYTLQLNFAKDVMTPAKKAWFKVDHVYNIEIEGFLSTRSYDKDTKHFVEPVIIVTAASNVDHGKPIEKKERPQGQEEALEEPIEYSEDDLPF